jgi:PAS domain S-box-containing protein
MALAQSALLLLIVFIVDGIRQLTQRGELRRAIWIGGSLLLLILGGTSLAIISYWGIARIPAFMAIFFFPAVIAMGAELSIGLARSLQLGAALRAAEADLRNSEQKLTLAADAGSAGLWSINLQTGELWATSRAMELLGLPLGRHLALSDFLGAVHADDRDLVDAFIKGPRNEGQLPSVEYRVRRPDGSESWCASFGRLSYANGIADSVMGATIDIGERKRAEEEAARQRSALEHLSRVATLSELSGALAHELNQPLATIMSNAEAAQRLLQDDAPDIREIDAILRDIVDADERAGEVIKRLRSLLLRGSPNTAPVLISELARGVLGLLRSELIQRGVQVELLTVPGEPTVLADRVPIEQVLINVIGNACDAMSTNVPGDRRLRISVDRRDGLVITSVHDVGCGLPADGQRVFEPFFSTKPSGLGMGLSISRSIVAAHGGRLWAEANPDRGATFHIGLKEAAGAEP